MLIAERYSPISIDSTNASELDGVPARQIIAPARRFVSIIYYTFKNDSIFEDFPSFVMAEATA